LEKKYMKSDTEKNRAPFSDYPDLLDVEQLSNMLGISTKTAYKMLRSGNIESIRIGRDYKIAKINVLKFLNLLP